MQTRRNTSIRYPGGTKSVAGFLAYFCGYVLFYGVFQATSRSFLGRVRVTLSDGTTTTLLQTSGGDVSAFWHTAGVLWYNAHFVPVNLLKPENAATSRIRFSSPVGGFRFCFSWCRRF